MENWKNVFTPAQCPGSLTKISVFSKVCYYHTCSVVLALHVKYIERKDFGIVCPAVFRLFPVFVLLWSETVVFPDDYHSMAS